MTLRRDRILSPNYSSRGGSTVTTICLHTAEGARTYQSLGQFFQNPRAGVSSHVGIDDTPGVIGEYVYRQNKAWTASAANPWLVQAELCGFARWSAGDWAAHFTMIDNTGAWIAEEAAIHGIPLIELDAAGAQNPNVRGVCQHVDLGRMGGGHWDCGPGFPIGHVLELARGHQTPPSPPSPAEDDLPLHIVIAKPNNDGGKWWLTDWVSKWWLPSADVAAQIIVSTRVTGGKIECSPQNGPIEYAAAAVDAVPEGKSS